MRLLFYSDVEVFGGHEVTVLDAIEGAAMAPGVSIGVAYCKRNRMLGKRLMNRFGAISMVEILPHDFVHEAGDLLRAFVPSSKRQAIAGFISGWKPDVVIVCQGHMGVSICGLAAAVGTDACVISYIPMAHTLREMTGGRSLTVRTVDALLARAYRWPAIYLTIDACVAEQLKSRHGVDGWRVQVIEYGPDIERLRQVSRSVARADLGLGGEFFVGMVGRVDFRQKGHDIILDAIARRGGLPGGSRLVIIGDGPDSERARSFVKDHGLDPFVRFLPWCDDVSSVYSALDLLLLPSRYEGAPIVMMEAMLFGLPVIASDVDGMRSVLPDEWRFAPGNGDQLMQLLERVRHGIDPGLLERHKQYIIKTRNAARFRERIGAFVTDLCGSRGTEDTGSQVPYFSQPAGHQGIKGAGCQ